MNDPSAQSLRPVVSHEIVHASGPFEVVAQTIEADDGTQHERTSIRHNGAVVILAILDGINGPEILLVRNERHAVERWLFELPAGGIEVGEPAIEAAGRELREETGYAAATIRSLGRFYTSPGLTNELMEAFVATDLSHVGQDLDAGELLTVHPVSVGRLFDQLDAGEVTDGKTMLTLLLARRRGWIPE